VCRACRYMLDCGLTHAAEYAALSHETLALDCYKAWHEAAVNVLQHDGPNHSHRP
jgi:hypothetical protein